MDKTIQKAINGYLKARRKILEVGEEYPRRIGGNDNIIGRIGEFYAIQFLESRGEKPRIVYRKSNPGYDLEDGDILTQVKVITAENEIGRTTRLKQPWTQFLLIEFCEDYKPDRIGFLKREEHQRALKENPGSSKTPYASRTMLNPGGLIGRYGEVEVFNEFKKN